MAGITLDQAQTALAGWIAADAALQTGQSVRHENGRTLTRADAGEIRQNIEFWNKQCQQLAGSQAAGGHGRSRTVSANW